MKIIFTLLLFVVSLLIAYGQRTDTLSFYSEAMQEKRTIIVHTPEFYSYQSDSVKLPVIYILDGQHEWFVNPLLSDIRYLQYTKEIPACLVVEIPLNNRVRECSFAHLNEEMPLDRFIYKEVNQKLSTYNPGNYKLLIGHSFSASFALYTFHRHRTYYTSVMAHTPLHQLAALVEALQHSNLDHSTISLSIGGIASDKDFYHRSEYDKLKVKHPDFFASILYYEANASAHNAVPLVATPSLLTQTFAGFSSRYTPIACVDQNYTLIEKPLSVEEELKKILAASRLGPYFYPPGLPDINGIASRYWHSGYTDHACMVYELGIKYYPRNYEFYLSAYECYDSGLKPRHYLLKAIQLLESVEPDFEGKDELLQEIREEIEKQEK